MSSLKVPELCVNNLPVLLPAAAAAATRQWLIVIVIQHDRVAFRHAHLVQADKHGAAACGSRHTRTFKAGKTPRAADCFCSLCANVACVGSRLSPLSADCPRAVL